MKVNVEPRALTRADSCVPFASRDSSCVVCTGSGHFTRSRAGQSCMLYSMLKSGIVKPMAWALALVLVSGLGWWGYRAIKKSELQTAALALVQDSTVLLREALGLVAAGSEVRSRLESSYGELQKNVQKAQALDASLNPPLVRAADAYITDVHSFLRRQIDTHKSRDAVRVDMNELSDHLRSAGERSTGWIRRALELKQRLERDYFDYRFAAGGLDKSFGALRETRKAFDPLAVRATVVDELLIIEAQERMKGATAQLDKEVEAARQLPTPR